MGKQKGKNAFFHYMIYIQNELKKEGKHLSLNDKQLHDIAGNQWKNMNSDERKPFEERAKADKEKKKIEITPKTYAQRDNNELQSKQTDVNIGREVYLDEMSKCCVNACKTREQLINASFFICTTTVMVKTDSNQFPPLEIGITQFSIKNGIQFNFHKFIDCGPIPLGYARLAQEFMRDYHKIPLDNFYEATNDYQRLVEDMIQILSNSRFTDEVTNRPTPMIVFSMDEDITQLKGVFEWLAVKYREYAPQFKWDVEVCDLVNLLFEISDKGGQRIIPAMAEDKLTSSAFDYSADTNCAFHELQDNRFCAQGKARRLCYMLSEVLCPMFEIIPTQKHLPPKRTNIVAESYVPVLQDFKPYPHYRYTSRAESSNVDNDWSPNNWSDIEPKQESRPQSRSSETSNRMAIGRGNRPNRYSDGSRPQRP